MKRCVTCGNLRDETEYNWRNKQQNKRWGTCRDCQKAQKNRWYRKNRKRHIQNMVAQRLSKQEKAREFIWYYLSSHPCSRCNESDPRVLEFHHVGDKEETVMRLVANGYSIRRIQKEIDICIVLCANCHKRETYKGSWRDEKYGGDE